MTESCCMRSHFPTWGLSPLTCKQPEAEDVFAQLETSPVLSCWLELRSEPGLRGVFDVVERRGPSRQA